MHENAENMWGIWIYLWEGIVVFLLQHHVCNSFSHKMSKNLSSFTLSLSLYDQVFLEAGYFLHMLTKEEELILLLESEKYPTLTSSFCHMQCNVLTLCPSEETLEGCVGKGITNVLLYSINPSSLFSIFTLWNMCTCFSAVLLWHCPSLCPSCLCNAMCCAGVCWTRLEQLQAQQPLEVLLG